MESTSHSCPTYLVLATGCDGEQATGEAAQRTGPSVLTQIQKEGNDVWTEALKSQMDTWDLINH